MKSTNVLFVTLEMRALSYFVFKSALVPDFLTFLANHVSNHVIFSSDVIVNSVDTSFDAYWLIYHNISIIFYYIWIPKPIFQKATL